MYPNCAVLLMPSKRSCSEVYPDPMARSPVPGVNSGEGTNSALYIELRCLLRLYCESASCESANCESASHSTDYIRSCLYFSMNSTFEFAI